VKIDRKDAPTRARRSSLTGKASASTSKKSQLQKAGHENAERRDSSVREGSFRESAEASSLMLSVEDSTKEEESRLSKRSPTKEEVFGSRAMTSNKQQTGKKMSMIQRLRERVSSLNISGSPSYKIRPESAAESNPSLHVTPQKLSNRISFSKLVVGPRLKSWRKGDPDAAISRVASVREGEHGKLHELITVRLRHFGVPTSNFVIDPRNRLLRQWDVLVIGLVLLTAITVPYETVYMNTANPTDAIFVFNRVLDLAFFVDIIVHFFVSFFDADEGLWVYDIVRIQLRYLRTSWVTDCLSLMPLDWLNDIFHFARAGTTTYRNLNVFQVSNLFKLLRALRIKRINRRIETSMDIDYVGMELMKFGVLSLMLSHWIACLYGLIELVEDTDATWLSVYLCDDKEWGPSCAREDMSSWSRYLAAMYWTVTTLTTIGYGDVLAVNDAERLLSVLVMLVGAFQYGYIIGALGSMLAARDEVANRFMQMMTELNAFMQEAKVPQHMREKLREYFRFRMSAPDLKQYQNVLEVMTPGLQKEVCMYHDGKWINNVELFRSTPEKFVVEIAHNIQQQTHPPFDRLFEKGDEVVSMHIIKKGLVECGGCIYRKFSILMEECLYKEWRYEVDGASVTFVEIWVLERARLWNILEQFPDTASRIRHNAIRRIFRLEILAYALAARFAKTSNLPQLLGREVDHTMFFSASTKHAVSYRAADYYKKLIVLHGLSVSHQKKAINAVNTIKHNWTRGKARKQRKEMIRMRQITGAKTDVLLTLTAERKQQIQLNQITQSLNEVMREQKIISERMAGHFTHVQMLVKRNAAEIKKLNCRIATWAGEPHPHEEEEEEIEYVDPFRASCRNSLSGQSQVVPNPSLLQTVGSNDQTSPPMSMDTAPNPVGPAAAAIESNQPVEQDALPCTPEILAQDLMENGTHPLPPNLIVDQVQ